jgi:muramoyltetrapeptide carboxypeptidase
VSAKDAWLIPPPLAPGAIVRVVAPSGPFASPLVWRGLGWLAERYRVRFDRGIFSACGYLAGDDERRRQELSRALSEPDVAAILCARGGYGASRFAHDVDWSLLRAHPRWLVGFSDVTALHVEAAAVRVASIHGPNVTSVGRSDADARQTLIDALERPDHEQSFDELACLAPGTAEGRLFGGNLTLLHACAAAKRLRIPARAVLFIEDVGERPYRIDRMLATLRAGGHLREVAGIVLGEFSDCQAAGDGVSVESVAHEVLGDLGVPIASGAPIGHGRHNRSAIVGALAKLTCAPASSRFVFRAGSSGV